VNEAEAHVVREALALFLTHRQVAINARELNLRGLLPSASKCTNSTRGALWTKDGLAYLLKSPIHVGNRVYGIELFDGERKRLIDIVTYQQAQNLLASRAQVLRNTGTRTEYLLQGLLCSYGCGASFTPGSTTKASNGKRYRFYSCSMRDTYGRAHCTTGNLLPSRTIEECVVERIAEVAADCQLAQRV